jgi:hypothetical protein
MLQCTLTQHNNNNNLKKKTQQHKKEGQREAGLSGTGLYDLPWSPGPWW